MAGRSNLEGRRCVYQFRHRRVWQESGRGYSPGRSYNRAAAEVSDFEADLEQARKDRTPTMALRRFDDGSLDDVVVEDVETFRAEFMSEDDVWMCCYFRNGERVTFHITTTRPANRKQGILLEEGEMPERWIDWDDPKAGPKVGKGLGGA